MRTLIIMFNESWKISTTSDPKWRRYCAELAACPNTSRSEFVVYVGNAELMIRFES
jgi:hypothetical protein